MQTAGTPEHSFYHEMSMHPATKRTKIPLQRPRSVMDQAAVFKGGLMQHTGAGPRFRAEMSGGLGGGGGERRGSSAGSSVYSYSGVGGGGAGGVGVPVEGFNLNASRSSLSLNRSSRSVVPYRAGTITPERESWVRRRYFNQRPPSVMSEPAHRPGTSHYGQWHHADHGRPSAKWMQSTSPRDWPASRPGTSAGQTGMSLGGSGYLQSLRHKSAGADDGRLTLTLTAEEKALRKGRERAVDLEDVRGLKTPEGGKREQLFEEVLRQLQGDGPMERLQARLLNLDPQGTGRVSNIQFRSVLFESDLQDRHVTFLENMAGTERRTGEVDAAGRDVVLVQYAVFLEILRLARNRKMAGLQRAREMQKKGLMRWQFRQVVRFIKEWKGLTVRHKKAMHRAMAASRQGGGGSPGGRSKSPTGRSQAGSPSRF